MGWLNDMQHDGGDKCDAEQVLNTQEGQTGFCSQISTGLYPRRSCDPQQKASKAAPSDELSCRTSCDLNVRMEGGTLMLHISNMGISAAQQLLTGAPTQLPLLHAAVANRTTALFG